ncbi:MAG: cyanophycinase [Bacteroidetes bacterium]|nr:cyanophycinase [Bacteroidota bacterium]
MLIPKGKLIAIGGNEDKGSENEPDYIQRNNLNFFNLQILGKFKKELGKEDPRIEVISSASKIPYEIGEIYHEAFTKLGCTNVESMHIKNPEDAQKTEFIERIKQADGVLFTGGNQLRLSTIYGESEILNILKRRYLEEESFIIAGTSAGAMAMSDTMIYRGSSAESLLKGEVKVTNGLGLINNVVIDTHFVTRGRFGRLAQAVATNPLLIGVGLADDTGVIISGGNNLEAIGSGLVIIVDGFEMMHTNITEIREGSPIAIENLIVHVMARGNHYDLSKRKFEAKSLAPSASEIEKEINYKKQHNSNNNGHTGENPASEH